MRAKICALVMTFTVAVAAVGCSSSGDSDVQASATTAAAAATTTTEATTTTSADDFVAQMDSICSDLNSAGDKLDNQGQDIQEGDFEAATTQLESALGLLQSAQSDLAALSPPPEAEDAVLTFQEAFAATEEWFNELIDASNAQDATTLQQLSEEGPDVDSDAADEASQVVTDLGATSCSPDA